MGLDNDKRRRRLWPSISGNSSLWQLLGAQMLLIANNEATIAIAATTTTTTTTTTISNNHQKQQFVSSNVSNFTAIEAQLQQQQQQQQQQIHHQQQHDIDSSHINNNQHQATASLLMAPLQHLPLFNWIAGHGDGDGLDYHHRQASAGELVNKSILNLIAASESSSSQFGHSAGQMVESSAGLLARGALPIPLSLISSSSSSSSPGSGFNQPEATMTSSNYLEQAASGSEQSTWSLLMSALFYQTTGASNGDFEMQEQQYQMNWCNILLALFLIMLMLTTAIGNLFVIVAILMEKNLRTVGNYLVLSLAIADLLVACLVMPLAGIYQILERWTLGILLCDIWTSADVFCCTASILHLLAIALDRYWAVTRVDYIRCQRNERRILFMIFFVWMAACVISLAPVFGWKDDQFEWRITNDKECLISQDVGYQIFATCTTFYFPLILTLIFYWKIYQVARRRIRRKLGNRAQIKVKLHPAHPSSSSSVSGSPGSKLSTVNQRSPLKLLNESNRGQIVRRRSSNNSKEENLSAKKCDCHCECHEKNLDMVNVFPGLSGKHLIEQLNDKLDNTFVPIHRSERIVSIGLTIGTNVEEIGQEQSAEELAENKGDSNCHKQRNNILDNEQSNDYEYMRKESATETAGSNSTGAITTNDSNNGSLNRDEDISRNINDETHKNHTNSTSINIPTNTTTKTTPLRADMTICDDDCKHSMGNIQSHLEKLNNGLDCRCDMDSSLAKQSPIGESIRFGRLATECGKCRRNNWLVNRNLIRLQHDNNNNNSNNIDQNDNDIGFEDDVNINDDNINDGNINNNNYANDNCWPPQTMLHKQRKCSNGGCNNLICNHRYEVHKDNMTSSIGLHDLRGAISSLSDVKLHNNSISVDQGANSPQTTSDSPSPPGSTSQLSSSLMNCGSNKAIISNRAIQSSLCDVADCCDSCNCCDDNNSQTNNNNIKNDNNDFSQDEPKILTNNVLTNAAAPIGNSDYDVIHLIEKPLLSESSPEKLGISKCEIPDVKQSQVLVDDRGQVKCETATNPSYEANREQQNTKAPSSLVSRSDFSSRISGLVQTNKLLNICLRHFDRGTSKWHSQPTHELSYDREASVNQVDGRGSIVMLTNVNSGDVKTQVCQMCHCNIEACDTSSSQQQQRQSKANTRQMLSLDADMNNNNSNNNNSNNNNHHEHRLMMAASTANIAVSTFTAIAANNNNISTKVVGLEANDMKTGGQSGHNPNPHNQSLSMEGVESKRERKAAKTLSIITGVFVMCWLPFFIMAITMPLLELRPHKYLFAFLLWLGYANSMLNPIIYTIFSPDFRKAFKNLLCGVDGNQNGNRRRLIGKHGNDRGNYNDWTGVQPSGFISNVEQRLAQIHPFLTLLCCCCCCRRRASWVSSRSRGQGGCGDRKYPRQPQASAASCISTTTNNNTGNLTNLLAESNAHVVMLDTKRGTISHSFGA